MKTKLNQQSHILELYNEHLFKLDSVKGRRWGKVYLDQISTTFCRTSSDGKFKTIDGLFAGPKASTN